MKRGDRVIVVAATEDAPVGTVGILVFDRGNVEARLHEIGGMISLRVEGQEGMFDIHTSRCKELTDG